MWEKLDELLTKVVVKGDYWWGAPLPALSGSF